MNTLKGGDPRKFAPKEITEEELFWYQYPGEEAFTRAKIKIIYLGYFMPDFNDHTNCEVAVEHGLAVRKGWEAEPQNIGGIYPHVALDDDFVIVNQMMKYLKFGFGKCTQEVGSAIRFGLMTREQGVNLVREYDGQCAPVFIEKLCDYLEISKDEFWEVVDGFVNKNYFKKDSFGLWKPNFKIK